MFKKIKELLELKILILSKELERLNKTLNEDIEEKWHIETGKKFNDLISKYPISEDELLSMAESVCKFVALTRITNIDEYLFKDNELKIPRLR